MRMQTLSKCAVTVAALALAGCGGADVGKQISTNEQMREQVMGAISTNPDLAVVMQQKLLANDSLRTKLVDTVLQDSKSSEYVLYRIATNQAAVDLVLRAAVADSAMRTHLLSVMKGVEMAEAAKK